MLQRGEEGQGCSLRDRAPGTEQGARDLLERFQRRVDLERYCRGALVADVVALKAGCSEERMVRDARGGTGPPAQSRARPTYENDVSVALLLSGFAAAPSSPIWFIPRLEQGEEGQGCSWRDREAGTEQGARDLLERRQRRVDLERLRKRRGARGADLVALKAAVRRVLCLSGLTL
jgi:hypothetical protein